MDSQQWKMHSVQRVHTHLHAHAHDLLQVSYVIKAVRSALHWLLAGLLACVCLCGWWCTT